VKLGAIANLLNENSSFRVYPRSLITKNGQEPVVDVRHLDIPNPPLRVFYLVQDCTVMSPRNLSTKLVDKFLIWVSLCKSSHIGFKLKVPYAATQSLKPLLLKGFKKRTMNFSQNSIFSGYLLYQLTSRLFGTVLDNVVMRVSSCKN
jgi:hypothetical protein